MAAFTAMPQRLVFFLKITFIQQSRFCCWAGCFLSADGERNLSATLQGACWGGSILSFSISYHPLRPADEGAT